MSSNRFNYLSISLTSAAIICLILGVSLPCINVSSQLFGFISIGSEQKSILGLIVNLLNNNILLAFMIILFSLIIPVAKLSLTLTMIISKNQNSNRFIQYILHNIGKWSMVDVFSMAIVVSMLTFDNMRVKVFSTQGQLLPGFYFFLSYGLLSIITTYFLNRVEGSIK